MGGRGNEWAWSRVGVVTSCPCIMNGAGEERWGSRYLRSGGVRKGGVATMGVWSGWAWSSGGRGHDMGMIAMWVWPQQRRSRS